MKRRNPRFGCVRTAQQVSHVFGIAIDKDVVRHVLAKHYRPGDTGSDGPSWLTFIAQTKGSLWSMDPFRFHRCLSNLRVLPIEELKSVPYAPVSHPFVERLIGTVWREYLDRAFFRNAMDLTRKLAQFQDYYTAHGVHRSLAGATPAQCAGAPSPAPAALDHYAWRPHCRGLFLTPIAA